MAHIEQIEIQMQISVSYKDLNRSYVGANLRFVIYGSERDLSSDVENLLLKWVRSFDHTQLPFHSLPDFLSEVFKESKRIWPSLSAIRLIQDSTSSFKIIENMFRDN